MTDLRENKLQESNDPSSSRGSENEEYLYQTAGIRERQGTVPLWLIGVAVGLFIWGAYYLLHYWSPTN